MTTTTTNRLAATRVLKEDLFFNQFGACRHLAGPRALLRRVSRWFLVPSTVGH